MNNTVSQEVLRELARQKGTLSRSVYVEKLLREALTTRIRMPRYLKGADVSHSAWKTTKGIYFGDVVIHPADGSAPVTFPQNHIASGDPFYERDRHPFSPFDCAGCQIYRETLRLVEEADPSRMEEGIPGIDYDPVTGHRFRKED